MPWMMHLESMTDDALLVALAEVVARGRRADAELVAHVSEVDARRLFLGRGCRSMFVYCTEVLRMSEGAAYLRIKAARAARRHPMLLAMLADGRLHLSGIERLAPHLTCENRDDVLARATHRSKRQIEELVAELAPKPDVASSVRKLPAPRPAPEAAVAQPEPSLFSSPAAPAAVSAPAVAAPPSPATSRPTPRAVAPLAPARYKVQFTASGDLKEKLDRLTAEMRRQVPDGDLATVIEIAVTEKLAAIEKRRYARADDDPIILSEGSAKHEPSRRTRKTLAETDTTPKTRHIPAAVRRAVRERDGDQCTFVSGNGRRCTARGGLELHHDEPFAKGGAHRVETIRLVCREHNVHLAERDYGAAHMRQFRSRAEEPRAPYAVHPRRAPAVRDERDPRVREMCRRLGDVPAVIARRHLRPGAVGA